MGETSLFALLSLAANYLYKSRKTITDVERAQISEILEKVKEGEVAMVTQFEDKWLKVPYLCVADHHLPETASSLFQAAFRYCLLDMSTQPPGQTAMLNLMSGLLKLSSQLYMTGVQALQAQLPPILCAKVFSAMKEVKWVTDEDSGPRQKPRTLLL